MSEDCSDFFGSYQDFDAVRRYIPKNNVTAITRSNRVFAPALSRICVNIAGTATVAVKSNPFGVNTMDLTLTTISASGEYLVPNAAYLVLDVTAVSGTVTAVLVSNED